MGHPLRKWLYRRSCLNARRTPSDVAFTSDGVGRSAQAAADDVGRSQFESLEQERQQYLSRLTKAKTTKQREFAAAGLLIGFAAIAGVSALFINGS